MNGQSLGRLEKVELGKYWENEAGHFTPWLAQEDNIALLSDVIGIGLEVEAIEKNVGPFRADILCKETIAGNWVLIENQLAVTDHKHMGQLLTYAAGLNAVTIVWIAARFTDEHRAVMDWLNEITNDKINFFGLEVELWKIGQSPMAPKFNVVCKPNDWTKTGKAPPDVISETKSLQLEYWTAFKDFLQKRKSFVKSQKPSPQHWTCFAIGRSYFHLVATVNTLDKRITVYLDIHGPEKEAHYHLLYKDRDIIGKEISERLDKDERLLWRELPDKKESQVLLSLKSADPSDKQQWPGQHEWLCKRLEALHTAFSQRVKKIDANDYLLSGTNGLEAKP